MTMDESVYALIPPPQHVPERPPMYHSKHPGRLDEKTLVYPMGVPKKAGSHATFGLPNGAAATSPSDFTRAHTGSQPLPVPAAPTRSKERVKGPTPKRTDKPLMNLVSGKNYVTANAIEAILASPKAPAQEVPATMRPGYGKVPKYLETNKQKVASERAQVEEYLRMRDAQASSNNVTQLSEGERQQLLAHLKTKWSSVNTAFQKLTFTLDTPSKVKRKEVYEQQLAEIEKDIRTLERGEAVLVVQD